jgi:hypothetical protein
MEVPNLAGSSVRCFDHHISVVNQIKISVVWQLRNHMEWSFNIESELFIQLSFLWFALPFISINNVPLLVDLIVLVLNIDVSVFCVNVSSNLDYLTFFVNNIGILSFEKLPPS